MKIEERNEIPYVAFDIEASEEETEKLINYARTHILDDKEELINYAVNRILRERVEYLKRTNKVLKYMKENQDEASKVAGFAKPVGSSKTNPKALAPTRKSRATKNRQGK